MSPPAEIRLRRLRGGGHEVDVLAYSTELSSQASASLRELLYEVLGDRARVRVAPPVPYGSPPPEVLPSNGTTHCTAVVFNLAQSPEWEVHGQFLEACKRDVEFGRGSGAFCERPRPELWQPTVQRALAKRSRALAKCRTQARGAGREAAEAELLSVLDGCVREILIELYPGAERFLALDQKR